MSLLFLDGFDHYVTADITKKWTSIFGGTPVIASSGRRSTTALQSATGTSTAAGSISKSLPSAISTIIVGTALYLANLSSQSQHLNNIFLMLFDGATGHIGIGVDSVGALVASRGATNISYGTHLGASAGGLISTGVWNHVEAKVTIHDSTGSVEVKLNGVTVLNLTNIDTRNGGNASVNVIYIGQFNSSGGTHFRFDDFCICDTAGSTNNNFLGDVRIDTLYPSGNGNYSQFLGSDGNSTDNYLLVDETTPNTTDYNDGSAVNDRDSYAIGNLSALSSQTVYGVQVNAAILKDDAGSKSAATFVRSSSTNGDGSSVALSTSQTYVSQVFETDPNGSVAWTETTVNAMEAGVKVTA